MIEIGELRRVARLKGLTNMGYAEKDYLQEILLLAVSREVPDLVFKGGTALYKIHGLDRFSEDLDFNGKVREKDIRRIAEYLDDFGYPTEVITDNSKRGVLVTYVSEGFLYRGTPETLARVRMDVSEGENLLDTEWKQLFPHYPDIPSFRLKTLSLIEMLAEKVRAMVVRRTARDAYDIWYLLNKGVVIDKALIQKKLAVYDLQFGEEVLNEAFTDIEIVWDKEMRALMASPPDFVTVKKEIIEKKVWLPLES